MGSGTPTQLRWVRQVRVANDGSVVAPVATTRERVLAALAERPQTVAQLAQVFGLSQPGMLEQVRRAVRDGLIVEVNVSAEERRFAAERYYAPAVPVVRPPDRELLESACRGITAKIAGTVARHWGDVEAAFAMTHLAREGWNLEDLQPYVEETLSRLVAERLGQAARPAKLRQHGLAWIEEAVAPDATLTIKEDVA